LINQVALCGEEGLPRKNRPKAHVEGKIQSCYPDQRQGAGENKNEKHSRNDQELERDQTGARLCVAHRQAQTEKTKSRLENAEMKRYQPAHVQRKKQGGFPTYHGIPPTRTTVKALHIQTRDTRANRPTRRIHGISVGDGLDTNKHAGGKGRLTTPVTN